MMPDLLRNHNGARSVSASSTDAHDNHNSSSINPNDPEYVKKEKSLRFCIRDGFFTSLKIGFTESYLMPFAIALNASSSMLAALSSLPQLVSSFFQLFAQESLSFFKTRKRLMVVTSLIQAFLWLPLIFIPFFAKDALFLIVLFATLEMTFGVFQGPIYNSVLGDLIEEDKRGEFFGKRNMVVNMMNFVATIIAGLILNFFKGISNRPSYIFIGFGILFFLAFVTRLVSSYYKSRIYDMPFEPAKKNIHIFHFLTNMTHDNYGIFVLYVFLFKLAASISAPFFALYLLRDMQMSYIYFTLIMGISIIASFFSMNMWGKFIDSRGSKFVLTVSGFLVPLAPFLMILAIYIKNPLYVFIFLMLEEAFSGCVWAGFNLSTSSFLYDATSKDDRIKYVAYYNFLVGVAVCLGAFLGGVIITKFPVWIVSSIPFILLTSGILRMLSTIIMIQKVREARMIEIDMPGRGFFHRIISIHPHYGQNIEIMGVYHRKESSAQKKSSDTQKPRKPLDPVKKEERNFYYKKSLDYYRENALKTLSEKTKQSTPKDDSEKVAKQIEKDKEKIVEIAESIRRNR
jgi:MFS family permease